MLSAFKNYAITFLIAAVIFSLIAFFVVEIIMFSIGESFFTRPTQTPGETTNPPETLEPADTTRPKDPLNGSSFNILLIGVDYSPSLFSNYDPDLVDSMTPETEPETTEPAITTEIPDIVAPPADITVAEDTTAAPPPDTGTLMPDGSLYFEGGFGDYHFRDVQTDTILLLRVDKERTQFTFTAFPPEMLLTIEGREIMLRDVFAEYGLDFLMRKINALTGLPVDRYALVNLDQFPEIVDTLDGITYNVPCRMHYDDYKGNLHINLTAGIQPLNGQQALDMLRFNQYTDPNQSRVKTAVGFIRAMLQKMTNTAYLPQVPELYAQVKNMIKTDFTADDLSANLDLIFKYGEYQLAELAFPGSYVKTADGTSVFKPNLTMALDYFDDYRRIYE